MSVELENLVRDIEKRVYRLESDKEIVKDRYDNIIKRLDKSDSNLVWLIRLVIGGMLMAIIGFVVKGGLVA